MYEYRAAILRVVDGDTVHADVDLGFDIHQLMTLRLDGINAPELATPEGIAARRWLIDILARAENKVVLTTVKDRREKYGRYLATLRAPIVAADGPSINAAMVYAGHAVLYDGGKR